MESTRIKSKSSPNLSLEEISTLIDGYYSYLMHHYIYLSRIENNQIDEIKINDYLYDIYGFDIKLSPKEFKDMIPKIKEPLRERLDIYTSLLKATKIQDHEQAVCTLNLLLELECGYESRYKHIAESKFINKEDKIQTAFHDYIFVKALHSSLQPLLPECYSDFATLFKVKESVKADKNSRDYAAKIVVNWNGLIRGNFKLALLSLAKSTLGDEKVKNIIQDAKNNKSDKNSMRNVIHTKGDTLKMSKEEGSLLLQGQTDTLACFSELKSILAIRNQQNKLQEKNIKNESDKYKYIEDNVATFFKIRPLLHKILNHANKLKDTVNTSNKCREAYKQFYIKFKKKNDKLSELQQILTNKINSLKPKLSAVNLNQEDIINDINQCHNDLNGIALQLKDLKQNLSSESPTNVYTEEHVQALVANNQNIYDDIASKLYCIENTFSFYTEQIQTQKAALAEAEKIKKEEIEKKRVEEQAALNKQREEFRANKELQLQLFKESEAKKREEKKLAKSIAANRRQNLFAEQHVQYKNLAMEERLLQLSPKKLALLKSILNLEDGILFKKACNLITKHLGGKIIEIGNGSSHKRIVLEKYILNIVTHSETNSDVSGNNSEIKSQRATGGCYKPHGKAHSLRTLSHFNLELVQKTLIKAGITSKVIEQLEKNKIANVILNN